MRKISLFMKTASLLLILVLVTACSNGASGNSDSEKKIVLKMANITKEDNELSLTLERVGKELEKQTDGRITAEYYPAGQLGNESDMLQQLNSGSLDVALITTAQLSNSSPAFGAWLMPFIVNNHEQAYKLWTSKESMALFDTLESENVVGLGYASSGFRYLLSTDPIDEVSDFNGLKLRTTPSPTILDFWKSLKAAPTPMPLTEVYTSLQTGVIGAVDIDSDSIVSEKLTEIATNMTPSNHMYWAGGILINKDLWNSLSKEDQQLIRAAVDKASKENSEQITKNEQNLLKNGKEDLGITIHPLKNQSEFDPHIKSVEDKWKKESPEIAAFLKKAEEIRSE